MAKRKPKQPRLPQGAWPAIIEAGPGCTHLLVWSDWLEEQGDDLGADALRWVHAKARWPIDGRWTHAPIKDVPHRIPLCLQKYYDHANQSMKWAPGRKDTAMRRLLKTWRILPDSVREHAWAWTSTDED